MMRSRPTREFSAWMANMQKKLATPSERNLKKKLTKIRDLRRMGSVMMKQQRMSKAEREKERSREATK